MSMIATVAEPSESANIAVGEMTSASCVAHVEKAIRAVPGVSESSVNLARGRAAIQFDPARTDPQQIADAISLAGYPSTPENPADSQADAEQQRLHRQMHEAAGWKRRAIVGLALWLPVELTHWAMEVLGGPQHHMAAAQQTWMGWLTLACSTVAIIYVGGKFYANALAALRRGTSNMDTLISMGASVAYGFSVTYFAGGLAGMWSPPMAHELYFMEASGLLALISLGHWLEARARQSAGSAIRELLELAPSTAFRLRPASKNSEFVQTGMNKSPLNIRPKVDRDTGTPARL